MRQENYAIDCELFGPDPIADGGPFERAAPILRKCGWIPLPLPVGKKSPPPDGYTGFRAKPVSTVEFERWIVANAAGNVASRMPVGVVGIDIDDYDDKHGAIDLARLEEIHGSLPPTWSSSSRGVGSASGIRFYRVPVGTRFPGGLSTSIEVIQPHHRYAVVAPSTHPEGRPYCWYDTGDEASSEPPDIDDLADLPWAWIEALSVKGPVGYTHDPASTAEVDAFIHTNVERSRQTALKGIQTSLGKRQKGRHDTLVERSCQVAREAAAGWYTAAEGFDLLHRWWNREMDNQRRLDGTEFADALAWGVGQANTEPERILLMRSEVQQRTEGSPPNDEIIDGRAGPKWTNLPLDFWNARRVLAEIRQAAHSRSIAADSVFGCVLARVATLTPPSLQLPPIVATNATLDVIVANVAESGGGKSASQHVGAEYLPIHDDDVVLDFPVGSGEGVVDAYLGQVEELDLKGKKVKVRRQIKRAVLANIDEGQVLTDFANRKGSTLIPTLRAAWSGSVLGQGNASAETNRRLSARCYRFAAIISVQPAHAAAILADAPGGTPQRILWFSAEDPSIPDTPPTWPGQISFTPPQSYILTTTFTVADDIADEIRTRKLARSRGVATGLDPLDSHTDLLRLKVAALLAVLDERLDVNAEDWRLAGMVMNASHAVRTLVAEHARQVERHREEAATGRAVRREVAVVDGQVNRTVDRCAKIIARKVREHGALTHGEAWRSLASRDRQQVTIDEVVEHAVSLRWLTTEGDTLLPGEAGPT